MDSLNSDALFVKHSTDELAGILLKIKTDADKKKFDLRRMVGDSYKDVIDAADAIGNMKTSTERLLLALEETQRHALPMGSKSTHRKGQDDKLTLYATAAKVKLLVITPEQIWNSIETKRLLGAARLFCFSRLVFANLQQQDDGQTKTKFRIIKNLWESIDPLKSHILDKAAKSLQSNALSSKDLVDVLFATGILTGSSVQDSYHYYLAQKRAHLLQVLYLDETPVLAKLLGFMETLKKVADEIADVFCAGALEAYCNAHSDETSVSTLSRLYSENCNAGLLLRYLPSSVKQTSFVLKPGAPLSSTSVTDYCNSWILNLTNSIHERIVLLLSRVSSGIELARMQSELMRTEKHLHSDGENLHQLFGERALFWGYFFEKAFMNRSKEIVEGSFKRFFSAADRLIGEELTMLLDPANDVDAGHNLWSQRIDGAPSLGNTLRMSHISSLKDLEQKLKSLTSTAVAEMKPLLNFHNHQLFIESVKNECASSWEAYSLQLMHNISTIRSEATAQETRIRQTLFIGYAGQIIAHEVSLVFDSISSTDHGSPVSPSRPAPFVEREKLQDLLKSSHALWIESVAAEAAKILADGLGRTDWSRGDSVESLWDETLVGDHGAGFPAVPSPFVTSVLYYVCKEINRTEAFSLDETCAELLVASVFAKVSGSFLEFLRQNSQAIEKEKCWTQIMFDYRFLVDPVGLPSRAGAPSLAQWSDIHASMLAVLSEHIKGYKLASTEQLLASSLSKCYFRFSGLFHPLWSLHPQPEQSKRAASSASEKHQLLGIAATVPRLSLLPVVTPSLINGANARTSMARGSLSGKVKPKATINLRRSKRSNSEANCTDNERWPGAGPV
ncbi:Golgi transport complex subunit 1 [Kappamyces sp. JEL0829]|nr:Golgi transport complex subunit 1 [Kappamyces sp. JEL0829]